MALGLKSLLERLAPRASVRRRFAILSLLAVVFVAVRLMWLEADPPAELPWGYKLRELVVEPVAKASEARNQALFGRWTPNAADEYQFWRAQSPFWVYPLSWFFGVFGVGIGQLRCFTIAYTLVGYVALLAIARQRLRGVELVLAALFPALDAVHILYSRSGLLEPAVSAWASVAVLSLLLARRHWAYLIGAQWAFVGAFFTKAAAVYVFPVLVAGSVWLLLRVPGAANKARARLVVLGHAALLGVCALAYVKSDAYMRTVIWNVNHVLLDRRGEAALVRSLSLWDLVRGAFDLEKLLQIATTVPITGPLALVETVAVALALLRRRSLDPWRVIVAGWFSCAFVTLLLISHVALRFDTVLPAPAALAAGSAIRTLASLVRRRAFVVRWYIAAGAALPFGAFNAWMYSRLFEERKYEVRDAASELVRVIGPRRAAIIGFWSAPAVFGTPYEHYYVKEHFNTSRATLAKLRITDLLYVVKGDYKERTGDRLKKLYPGLTRNLRPRTTFRMSEVTLSLYSLPAPLGSAGPKAAPRVE